MKRRKIKDTLHDRLGISQDYLAAYLGVSRTLISLYEKGERNLPRDAVVKLANLELLHHQVKTKKIPARNINTLPALLRRHEDKIKNAIQKKLDDYSYRLMGHEMALKRMIERYGQLRTSGEMLALLLSTLPNTAKKLERSALEHQQNVISKQLITFGQASQARLQMQIEILKAQEQIYKKWAGII